MTRAWLWLSLPLALIGLVVLSAMLLRLLEHVKTSPQISARLIEHQEITIDMTGPLLLHGEGPRFTTAFGKLDFQLIEKSTDRKIEMTTVWLKSSSSGIKHSRLSLRAFYIDSAGRFKLIIGGLDNSCGAETCRIVITQDDRGKLLGTIALLVVSVISFLAGLIVSLIVFLQGN